MSQTERMGFAPASRRSPWSSSANRWPRKARNDGMEAGFRVKSIKCVLLVQTNLCLMSIECLPFKDQHVMLRKQKTRLVVVWLLNGTPISWKDPTFFDISSCQTSCDRCDLFKFGTALQITYRKWSTISSAPSTHPKKYGRRNIGFLLGSETGDI